MWPGRLVCTASAVGDPALPGHLFCICFGIVDSDDTECLQMDLSEELEERPNRKGRRSREKIWHGKIRLGDDFQVKEEAIPKYKEYDNDIPQVEVPILPRPAHQHGTRNNMKTGRANG